MATLTLDGDGPGKSRAEHVYARGLRRPKIVTGKFSFDNSYPTGGESIADIFSCFATGSTVRIFMESPLTSAGTGKHVQIDYTNKKVKLLTNAATPAEVADTSDQSGATDLEFIAIGEHGYGATN